MPWSDRKRGTDGRRIDGQPWLGSCASWRSIPRCTWRHCCRSLRRGRCCCKNGPRRKGTGGAFGGGGGGRGFFFLGRGGRRRSGGLSRGVVCVFSVGVELGRGVGK